MNHWGCRPIFDATAAKYKHVSTSKRCLSNVLGNLAVQKQDHMPHARILWCSCACACKSEHEILAIRLLVRDCISPCLRLDEHQHYTHCKANRSQMISNMCTNNARIPMQTEENKKTSNTNLDVCQQATKGRICSDRKLLNISQMQAQKHFRRQRQLYQYPIHSDNCNNTRGGEASQFGPPRSPQHTLRTINEPRQIPFGCGPASPGHFDNVLLSLRASYANIISATHGPRSVLR